MKIFKILLLCLFWVIFPPLVLTIVLGMWLVEKIKKLCTGNPI